MVTTARPDMQRLVLGTVQWGLSYGIANRSGQPSLSELRRLIELADQSGVRVLDSGRAYGEAECRIGELLSTPSSWRIITKLRPGIWTDGMDEKASVASARQSFAESRRALGDVPPDTLLLHRGSQAFVADGALWAWLAECKADGEIRCIGVSAESPVEAWRCLELDGIDTIQVAASVLDQRLVRAGFFAAAAAREIEVLVRSVFLQGVAYLDSRALPRHLEPLAVTLRQLDALAEEVGLSRGGLFLCYARDELPGGILVGCETVDQLSENLRAWMSASLPPCCWEKLDLAIEQVPDECLDPSRWPTG